MTHHEEDKKEKIRKRNKRNWMIFQQVADLLKQVDIAAPDSREKPSKQARRDEQDTGVALPAIRNRLNNSRRIAEERWNRFAATGDSGGRGR